jgi:nuclear pore complex protein Nup205
MSYCSAKLALLLNISQTRAGATVVYNAGVFQAIKNSRLFSIDPDFSIGKQVLSSIKQVLIK